MSNTPQVFNLFSAPTKAANVEVVQTKQALHMVEVKPSNAQVSKLRQEYAISTIPAERLVLFGSERQKEFGSKLDVLLAELTKGGSPVLFELFNKLSKGVDQADLGTLEKEIRESLKETTFSKFMSAVGLSNAAKRIQGANERVNNMLTSKSKNLLDLTKEMQESTSIEVAKLINDSSKLQQLAGEFRENIAQFGTYVEAGKLILADAESELSNSTALASGDPLQIEQYKLQEQRVELFRSRLLVLETAYQNAPTELESIRIGLGASLSTLGETANSALEQFNSIKSTLIKLAVTHQTQSLLAMNDERRKLNDKLNQHATNQLGQVAQQAAAQQGIHRLEDAKRLLETATALKSISDKVKAETEANKVRFAEARTNLAQVKQLLNS